MNDLKSENYWTSDFAVTKADLDRLAQDIDRVGRAYELSELAHNIVRQRLLYGPEEGSTPAVGSAEDRRSIQWWDQAETISVGDHLFFLKSVEQRHVAYLGEVVDVKDGIIFVFLADLQLVTRYSLRPRESSQWVFFAGNYQRIREEIRRNAAERQFDRTNTGAIDLVMLEHGDRIVSSLLGALAEDSRFVRLSGRWFLRELALEPTVKQVEEIAWALFRAGEPKLTNELAGAVIPVATEDRWLFGVYLALGKHPELFENIDPGPQPRWSLVGPPPGTLTPVRAAYDPATYEVICQPGVEVSRATVQRLWDLELLRAVV